MVKPLEFSFSQRPHWPHRSQCGTFLFACRQERSFLRVGTGKRQTDDPHGLQDPLPRVEQSLHAVSFFLFSVSFTTLCPLFLLLSPRPSAALWLSVNSWYYVFTALSKTSMMFWLWQFLMRTETRRQTSWEKWPFRCSRYTQPHSLTHSVKWGGWTHLLTPRL